jgi:hypothetical protein
MTIRAFRYASPRAGTARGASSLAFAAAVLMIAASAPGSASAKGGYNRHPVTFDCAAKSALGRLAARLSNGCSARSRTSLTEKKPSPGSNPSRSVD